MIQIQEILENVYPNCQARSKEVSLQKLSKVLQRLSFLLLKV